MADLFVELLSEEIPARMQARAAEDLARLVTERLTAASLTFGDVRSYVTPRRLALAITDLPARQPDREEERKGPRVGAPDKAIQGFLRANGLDSLDQCETRTVGQAEFHFVVRRHEGQATREVLPDLLADAIANIPWPKSMRWADTQARYVRPLQGIIALLDGEVLSGGWKVGGAVDTVTFGNTTRGHRFLAPDAFTVTGEADWLAGLRERYVEPDRQQRQERIRAGTLEAAQAAGLEVMADPGLLEEVTGLVEWPVVLTGRIDDAFMRVPPEVLTTAMRTHQRYFALTGRDGKLAPAFLVCANIVAEDGGRQIVAGNERVLRARLADAAFFWDQDRKRPLDRLVPALDAIVFHARLGTLGEKVRRLEALAARIADYVPNADGGVAAAAARLAKADLVTGMVGEFPELQGLMGRYYALEQGQDPAVTDAIAQHYAPQGPGDTCPTAPVSVAVALADKIDTLAGFFAIDERPTGSRDPFALRRAALGVIRLILENGLRLPLAALIREAHGLYAHVDLTADADATAAGVMEFIADRLKVYLRERGVRHDHIAAVFALEGEDDLVRLLAQVEALAGFLTSEDGANLLIAERRARNIVRIESRKDDQSYDEAPDEALLQDDVERRLHAALLAARRESEAALSRDAFAEAMSALAALREPVDRFFDSVTVNSDDPALRANRLRLLSAMTRTMGVVADFSRLEG